MSEMIIFNSNKILNNSSATLDRWLFLLAYLIQVYEEAHSINILLFFLQVSASLSLESLLEVSSSNIKIML